MSVNVRKESGDSYYISKYIIFTNILLKHLSTHLVWHVRWISRGLQTVNDKMSEYVQAVFYCESSNCIDKYNESEQNQNAISQAMLVLGRSEPV